MSRSRQTVIAAFATLLVAAPAAAADCPSADAPPTGANTVEVRAAVVCLTNEQRAAAGLPALVAEGRLEAAAQAYSRRMVAERFFAHVAPDGSTLTDRLAAYTDWSTIGENIAWGEGSLATARSTVRAWMESPGHRANVLNGDFSEIGIGVALGSPVGSTGPAATMTQNFGARRSTAAGAPVSGTAASAPRPGSAPTGTRATVATPAARKPAARKPALRCKRGTVRIKGRRIVRCVRATTRRS